MEKPSVLSLILLRGDNNKHTHLFVDLRSSTEQMKENTKVEYHSSKIKQIHYNT